MATFFAAVCATGAAHGQTVTRTQNLAFGVFAADAGGSITIGTDGLRTASPGVSLLFQNTSTHAAASFEVTGVGTLRYSIVLPGPNTVVLRNAQNNSMAISEFSSSPSKQGQLSVTGSQTVRVGATLVVGSNQPPGNYTGSFAITVAYQ